MEEILGNIYCWFESLFSINLAEHLWGFDGNDYTGAIAYNSIGIIAGVISLVIVLVYYYAINHPRFCQWWSWLIMLLLNGFVNLLIGYSITNNALLNGEIADSLVYMRDESGEVTEQLISTSDCWGFGIANFIVATLFFILLSFILKWWSSNCKHSPFL